MSFSYSKLNLYKNCPKSYYFKYIKKLKVPFINNPIFEKGKFIHNIIESYPNSYDYKFEFPEVELIKDKILENTINFITNNSKAKFLLSDNVQLFKEKKFFLNKELQEIDGYANCLIDGIIDYVGKYNDFIILVDWKSGKTQNKASLDQLKFYSLYIFNAFPDINKLKLFLFFVEQDTYQYEEITKNDYKKIEEYYFNLIETIETDTEYKQKKNSKCIDCPFYKECQPYKINIMKGKNK